MPSKTEQMSRNILELKSIKVNPSKVRTLASARRVAKLKDFDLKEEYFAPVYHPVDLVKYIAYYKAGDTYQANVRVDDIKGTTHPSYYGESWLVMMMNLERHKEDTDVDAVRAAILNTNCFEPIQLSKFGDLYFVDGGGNHRVCQAKFLGIEEVPCEVSEWKMARALNPVLEEIVFRPDNVGPDCDLIAHYMGCFSEDYIEPALARGAYAEAAELYLDLLFALTDHFVADEHWCYFDDYYSPDYAAQEIWDKFVPYVRSGAIPEEALAALEAGLARIEKTEAYGGYEVPAMVPVRNLKEATSSETRKQLFLKVIK